MSYSVIPIELFKREAKRLAKKYSSLKDELSELSKALERNPEIGTPLGNNAFKVRLAIKSKGKGKSGGARVITYLITEDKEVYLLTIFDKSELDSIDDKILKKIIAEITKK
jgi:hypothetical protein